MTYLITIAVIIAVVAIIDAMIATTDAIRYTDSTDLDELLEDD